MDGSPPPGVPPGALTVDGACWVAPGVLAVLATAASDPSGILEIVAVSGGQPLRAPFRWISWPTSGHTVGALLVGQLPEGAGIAGPASIHADGRHVAVLELAAVPHDVRPLLERHLVGLDFEARVDILGFLATLASAVDGAARETLEDSLMVICEGIRPRRPYSVIEPDRASMIAVDRIVALSDRAFFVDGWFRAAAGAIKSLCARAPEGSSAELSSIAWLHARPDLEAGFLDAAAPWAEFRGFKCRFELDSPSRRPTGWVLEMTDASGSELETAAPRVCVDPGEALEMVVEHVAIDDRQAEALRVEHLRPAIEDLLARKAERATVARTAAYGVQPKDPRVTIVIPLYGRIDLLEHQLAHFSLDRRLAGVEVLYVLDSPELDQALAVFAPNLSELYGLPFRTVTLSDNGGFARANNVGAALASGQRLLLLNSDVVPDRPGWLSTMLDFYDTTPGIGALGAKLLYEDDTLQHAGLYFVRSPDTGIWDNRHYFKGLGRGLAVANVARPTPAVTAACMLVDTGLFRDVGGLSESFVQGDYEDSDLCLRLVQAGRQNWYLPQAELYHLEGQSYPAPLRSRNLQYNRWLHTQLWDEQIEALMARFATPPGSARQQALL